jgi:parallel beta-helix repeat protein
LKKIIAFLLIVLFLMSSLSPLINSIENQESNTIYVDDDNTSGPWDGTIDHPFQFIQDGIDAASEMDTVVVHPGVYDESLRISTSLHLKGLDGEHTIISSNNSSEFLILDGITHSLITNFTFSCMNHERLDIIRMRDCNQCTISHLNIFSDIIQRSALIVNGSSNIITQIAISGRFIYAGIELYYTDHNSILNNSIYCCGTGILVFRSHNNLISFNELTNNSHAIYLEEGNQNQVMLNNLKENSQGLFSSYSIRNNIEKNNFIENDEQAKLTKLLKIGFLASNNWRNNFWDDHLGFLIKPIPGLLYVPNRHLIGFFFPWFEFDWQPAVEPFDIG